MASGPSFKLENFCNGNKCKFEFKLSLPDNDNDTNSNTGMPHAHRNNRFGRSVISNGQLTPMVYEPGPLNRTENNAMNDGEYDSHSDSDSGIESLSVSNYSDMKHGLKPADLGPFNNFLSLKRGNREHIRMHLQAKKHDGFKRVVQREVTKYFKKLKQAKAISKQFMNGPNHNIVNPLGSYFEGVQFEAQDQMSNGQSRFNTFYNYSGNGNPSLLARNGFYHDDTEGHSSTRCFACNVRHSTWTPNDNVLLEHSQMSPQCPYLKDIIQNNARQRTNSLATHEQPSRAPTTTSAALEAQRYINLANSKNTREHGHQELSTCDKSLQVREQTSARFCPSSFTQRKQVSSKWPIVQESRHGYASMPDVIYGPNPRESNTQSSPTGSREMVNDGRSEQNVHPPSAKTLDNHRHPGKVSVDTRLRSFKGWPTHLTQTPIQLAEAGLFFVGVADLVQCFHCGVGLRNWDAEDDPVQEHTRWSPHCEFIKKLREELCITDVQRGNVESVTGYEGQHGTGAEGIDEHVVRNVKEVLREMGFPVDSAREAVRAVMQQTGSNNVTVNQAVSLFLDREESRSDIAVGGAPNARNAFSSSGPSRDRTVSSTQSFDDNTVTSVMAENQGLLEMVTCNICGERTLNITLLSCGHFVRCDACTVHMQRCPTCNKIITDGIESYMT